LSEGGLPTEINPRSLTYEGRHDFGKTVSGNLTFTAYPRFCPKTGDGFAWGFEKGGDNALHVFRLDAQTGKAETLYRAAQDGFYMAHDAMLTENYFLIVLPPMRYDFGALLTGRAATLGEALRYYENEPARLLVFPRDNRNGAAKYFTVEMPAHLVFHHGDFFESADGKIIFETVIGTDRRLLDVLANFKLDRNIAHEPLKLEQVTVDLTKQAVTNRTQIGVDIKRAF
jgi:all-trans-8'-apo-beta-carotenal 15,15'-oxygenase